MKKIILLTLTLVSANALKCMDPTSSFTKVSADRSLYELPLSPRLQRTGLRTEPIEQQPSYQTLPKELKQEIVKLALADSDETLNDAIAMLKKLSALHGVQYDKLFSNIKDFTKLVHMLSHKFKMPVNVIAAHFIKRIPTATTYMALSEALIQAIKNEQVERVQQLINDGADPNLLVDNSHTMLQIAINNRSKNAVEIVKILLIAGANPYAQGPADCRESLGDLIEEDEFFYEYSVDESESADYDIKQIIFPQFKKLIEEAMPRYSSYSSQSYPDESFSDEENISGEGTK